MKEESLQRSVASYLDILQEHLKDFTWFHVHNEGKHKPWYRKKMASAGVKSGVPDITIIRAKGRALFIELKVRGNYLSKNQKAFHAQLERLEIPVYTVKAENGGDAVAQVSSILEAEGMK